MRIKGWMGRADQTTKVKGMFVHPEQIAEIARAIRELGRVRLVVDRDGEQDVMTLHAETTTPDPGFAELVAQTLQDITKLHGTVIELVPARHPAERRQGHCGRARLFDVKTRPSGWLGTCPRRAARPHAPGDGATGVCAFQRHFSAF